MLVLCRHQHSADQLPSVKMMHVCYNHFAISLIFQNQNPESTKCQFCQNIPVWSTHVHCPCDIFDLSTPTFPPYSLNLFHHLIYDNLTDVSQNWIFNIPIKSCYHCPFIYTISKYETYILSLHLPSPYMGILISS